MSDRICQKKGCDNVLDRYHAKYCSDDCRQWASGIIERNRFTDEMTAELYEDAKAGRIDGWQ